MGDGKLAESTKTRPRSASGPPPATTAKLNNATLTALLTGEVPDDVVAQAAASPAGPEAGLAAKAASGAARTPPPVPPKPAGLKPPGIPKAIPPPVPPRPAGLKPPGIPKAIPPPVPPRPVTVVPAAVAPAVAAAGPVNVVPAAVAPQPAAESVRGRTLATVIAYTKADAGTIDTAGGKVDIPSGTSLIVKDPRASERASGPDGLYIQLDDASKHAGTWVRLDALDLGTATTADPKAGWKSARQAAGKVMNAYSVVNDMSGYDGYHNDMAKANGHSEAHGRTASGLDKQTSDNLSYAAGAGDVAMTFVTLANSITVLADKSKNGWDKGQAALDGVGALGKGAAGVAGIVKTASNEGGKSAEAVAGLAVFSGIFDSIKAAYTIVTKAVELAKAAEDPKKAKTGQEKIQDGMAIAIATLEMGKGVVATVKTFVDLANDGPTAGLTNTIPGFGIALGAADLIVRGVDLVFAMSRASRMRTDKRASKDVILGGSRSYSIFKRSASAKDEAKQIIADVDAKVARKQQSDPNADVEDVITDPAELEKYEAASDYLLTRGVQYINDKRRNRALYKMSITLGKISGDIAVLGGASAPVGAGIKAGAVATDIGFSAARKFKQWGRDRKAATIAKGKTVGGFWSIFNENKSTAAKEIAYNRDVDKLFSMIVEGARQDPAQQPKTFAKLESIVSAIGVSMTKVTALRDDPTTLREELVTAMKKRE